MTGRDVPGTRRPRSIVLAVLGLLLEVVAIVVAAGFLAAELVAGRAVQPGPTLATAVFAVLLATLLGAATSAVWAGRRWGRGPVITWQVLQGAVALSQVGSPGLVAALVGISVVVLGGMLAPTSVAWTGRGGPPVLT